MDQLDATKMGTKDAGVIAKHHPHKENASKRITMTIDCINLFKNVTIKKYS